MSPTADLSSSHTSQTRQDLWNEWKAQIGMLRSALLSKSPDSSLCELASGCLALYKVAYASKQCNANDAVSDISGRDRSPLEIPFMWLGGWRPTSAITLVYSTLGVTYREPDGVPASNDIETGPASTLLLAQEQLQAMETLQKHTKGTEVYLSNELATLQMLVADQSMTEALAMDTFSMMLCTKDWKKGRELMDIKVAALTNLFIQANQLRLQTLEELLRLLSPVQCAKCCISAFELVYAIKNLVQLRYRT